MSDSSSPSQYRTVGILLAIGSGLLIGTSFVFKKRGLLSSQIGHKAGEGVAYLKSPMWWLGMTMMICGELCNFGAYAFVEAIVVTPLGALSVVISAILSHLVLKEKLTLFGWIGCGQCILGAIIIALNGPEEQSVSTITAFKKLFLAPGFLSYGSVCIAASLVIIFFIAPKYGEKSMIWYILICSLIGGISVSCTQGLGACILTSIRGENQFKNWFIYFLLIFVICTLLTEIYYLNVALALFNTAMVTPTYYVLFTFCTLVTSIILYQGLKASASAIITIVLAFLVICSGISILQMSKIDPRNLQKLDRKTTILLQAAREEVHPSRSVDGCDNEDDDEEKLLEATEEPGMDSVAGRFSGIGGTVIRARRRATLANSQKKGVRRSGRARSGTTASAPGPSLARPSMASGVSSGSNSNWSTGMDSVRARQLHELWREEYEEKRGGDDDLTSTTQIFPVSESGGSGIVDGMPLGQISLNAYTKSQRKRVLSDEIVSSPTEASRTNSGELKKSNSVHFDERTASNNHEHSHIHNHTTNSDVQLRVQMPPTPTPALVSSTNTSLPSLHLPTPSFHLPSFLTRHSHSHSPNPQPTPILENNPKEQEEKNDEKEKLS